MLTFNSCENVQFIFASQSVILDHYKRVTKTELKMKFSIKYPDNATETFNKLTQVYGDRFLSKAQVFM